MTLELVETKDKPDFTAIVSVSGVSRIAEMLTSYREALDGLGRSYELICITDYREDETVAGLMRLEEGWPELVVLAQRPWSDEDAALLVAIKRARSDMILTLPGWPEIDPEDLGNLWDALGDYDLVVASRTGGAAEGGWKEARREAFNSTLRRLFKAELSDPFCRVRLGRKEVLEDAGTLGTRQHFIPAIVAQRGYKVTEATLRRAPADATAHARFVFKPIGHIRALLDALMLYVVLNFLRRPLRFFGSVGLPILVVGGLLTFFLVLYRLFGATALADRPILIFAVLMVVLGIQIIAMGLVGEIIIFANARRMKQYSVRSIIHDGKETPVVDDSATADA